MYCRSCGAQLAAGAYACVKCGKAPLNGNAYCMSCGAPSDPQAIVCVKCGVGLNTPGINLGSALGSGPITQSNRVVVGICALLLGAFGIHKFLLGYTQAGIIMLVVTVAGHFVLAGLGSSVMAVIGIVEGVIYLTKSDADFHNTYVANKKEWF